MIYKFRTQGAVHNLNRIDSYRKSHSERPNHQGHRTTLLQSEILFLEAQAMCVGEVNCLESTESPCGKLWSQVSICKQNTWVSVWENNCFHDSSNFQWSPYPLDLKPQIFICGDIPQGLGLYQQLPKYPDLKTAIRASQGGMREGHQEFCPPDPIVPVTPRRSFRAHFWAPVKQTGFVLQTWNVWVLCLCAWN